MIRGGIFDQFNAVHPDLVFLSNERKKRILNVGRLTAAPEIVVEAVSPVAAHGRSRIDQVKPTPRLSKSIANVKKAA